MDNDKPAPKKSIFLTVLVIVVLLVLATLLVFLIWLKAWQKPSPNSQANSLTNNTTISNKQVSHKNTKYKFTFNYPAGWAIEAFPNQSEDDGSLYPDYIFVTKQKDASGLPQKAGTMLPIEAFSSDTGKTFEKASSERVLQCGADSPGASASCDKITRQRQFTSQNGLAVLEFYVNLKIENCPAEGVGAIPQSQAQCQTSQKEIGPIYFLDTYNQTGGKLRMIEMQPEFLDGNALSVPAETLLSIIQSVKFY